jgi:TolB-like protein
METNYNCKYCGSNFKRRDLLFKHQNNAQYCLNIQLREKEREREREQLKTELENTKRDLESTKRECEKLKIELESTKRNLEDMKEDRDDYKDKVFSLANNPINNYTALTNTNTHNGNNNILMLTPFDMNKQKFSDVIKESFTKDYMIEGQKGVAKFAVDKLLKDEDGKLQYVCTDPSRQIYKFKTIEGDVERDVKAQKLTKNIIDELKRKSQSIVVADMNSDADVFMLIANNFQEINGMEGDNSDFRNTLASLTVC